MLCRHQRRAGGGFFVMSTDDQRQPQFGFSHGPQQRRTAQSIAAGDNASAARTGRGRQMIARVGDDAARQGTGDLTQMSAFERQTKHAAGQRGIVTFARKMRGDGQPICGRQAKLIETCQDSFA